VQAPLGSVTQAITGALSAMLRKRASLSRNRRAASTPAVVSVQAQYMPATLPLSSRTGEYEKVNHVSSS